MFVLHESSRFVSDSLESDISCSVVGDEFEDPVEFLLKDGEHLIEAGFFFLVEPFQQFDQLGLYLFQLFELLDLFLVLLDEAVQFGKH